jgi:two-component system, LytTR family, sensor kinase
MNAPRASTARWLRTDWDASGGSSGTATFWVLQTIGWLAYVAALTLPWVGAYRLLPMLHTKAIVAGAGLLVSLVLRRGYRSLLRTQPPAQVLAIATLAASCGGALVWTAAAHWLVFWIGPDAAARRGMISASVGLFDGTLQNTLVLTTWSVLYLGINYFHALHLERERSLRAETMAHRARLQALRYQVNPHFLFNTLNAVSTLIVEGRLAEANRALARLGDFFRATLDEPDEEEVPLRDEIEFVRRYLEVEQVRFGDRLTVRIDVEPGAGSTRVPSMILQPVVENAARHAVARRTSGGEIAISATLRGGILRVTVTDNGPGLPLGGAAGEGIGLHNTRQRMRELYGDRHRLELIAAEGGGLTAVFEFPAHDDPRRNVVNDRDSATRRRRAGATP